MKQTGPKQEPHPAASESHYEATAGFYQVNSQLYLITSLLILTGSMTTSGRELTLLLALYSPPLTAPLSTVLTTTAGSNQSVTSELHCNKMPSLATPPFFFPFFPFLLFLSWLFSEAGLSNRKPQGSSRPFDSLHPPRLRLEEARPYFEPPLLGCFPPPSSDPHVYI